MQKHNDSTNSDPIILLDKKSQYDTNTLLSVLTDYAKAIEVYAQSNGFEVEFISDEVAVYSNSRLNMINNAIVHDDTNGNPMKLSGVATKTDLVVLPIGRSSSLLSIDASLPLLSAGSIFITSKRFSSLLPI